MLHFYIYLSLKVVLIMKMIKSSLDSYILPIHDLHKQVNRNLVCFSCGFEY